MMTNKSELFSAIRLSMSSGTLKKLTLSKPDGGTFARISGRLCLIHGEDTLAIEASFSDGKILHRSHPLSDLTDDFLTSLLLSYKQLNLVTAVGDAEYKRGKSGTESYLRVSPLLRKLESLTPDKKGFFKKEIAMSLDRKKNYILSGNEPFLKELGISDQTGRIHDKKQAKYRQINRFLEHVEEVYSALPQEGSLLVYDLCCGKSYLSFAVYHYLAYVKKREVEMLGIDQKTDVIAFCQKTANAVGFTGMHFHAGDIRQTPHDRHAHLVISLHACDIATDIVLDTAASLSADVILSTPCCHRYFEDKIKAPSLAFMTDQPFLRHKLNETLTDALRTVRLSSLGYRVTAVELTDPDDTPKNTLLRAIRQPHFDPTSKEAARLRTEYAALLTALFDEYDSLLPEVSPK